MIQLRFPRPFRRVLSFTVAVLFAARSVHAAAPTPPTSSRAADDVTRLPAFNVTGERLEDFGFRVSPDLDHARSTDKRNVYTPVVDVVLPNTAASKADLRPGDRILAADGKSTAAGSMSATKWRGLQEEKWREVTSGKPDVVWTLTVETAGSKAIRTLTLQLPTPAPHWGASNWRPPVGRAPAVVREAGPLAQRAHDILDHGVWMILRQSYVRGFQLPTDAAHPHFLCYEWTLWDDSVGHRMYVSQQRGRTDIVFEVIYRQTGGLLSFLRPVKTPEQNLASATTLHAVDSAAYLTSPSGVLEAAWRIPYPTNNQKEIPLRAASAGFQAEVDFWLRRVTKTSGLWPFGLVDASAQVP